MIKKLIFTTLIFFAIHFTLVKVVFPDAKGTYQYGWQINLLAAEEFMFGDNQYDYVLLGSSLTQRITSDLMPSDDWYNLSLSGMGIHEGFEIVKNAKNKPKYVLVESNMMLRDPNDDFLKSIFNSPTYPVKKHLGYLMEYQKPVPLIEPFVEEKIVRKGLGKVEFEVLRLLTGSGPADPSQVTGPLNDPTTGQTIKQQLIEKYDVVNDSIFDVREAKLRENITYCLENDIDVIFYEMPLQDFVCELQSFTQVRNLIKDQFSGQCCQFIEQPDCSEYQTTDGLHLNRENIQRYSEYFFQEVLKKTQQNN